jgi:hypothetical protein
MSYTSILFSHLPLQYHTISTRSCRIATTYYFPLSSHTFPLYFPSFWSRKSESRNVCLRFFLCFGCPVYCKAGGRPIDLEGSTSVYKQYWNTSKTGSPRPHCPIAQEMYCSRQTDKRLLLWQSVIYCCLSHSVSLSLSQLYPTIHTNQTVIPLQLTICVLPYS